MAAKTGARNPQGHSRTPSHAHSTFRPHGPLDSAPQQQPSPLAFLLRVAQCRGICLLQLALSSRPTEHRLLDTAAMMHRALLCLLPMLALAAAVSSLAPPSQANSTLGSSSVDLILGSGGGNRVQRCGNGIIDEGENCVGLCSQAHFHPHAIPCSHLVPCSRGA